MLKGRGTVDSHAAPIRDRVGEAGAARHARPRATRRGKESGERSLRRRLSRARDSARDDAGELMRRQPRTRTDLAAAIGDDVDLVDRDVEQGTHGLMREIRAEGRTV